MGEIVAFTGVFSALVVLIVRIGRWAGGIGTLLKRHGNAIEELKTVVKLHNNKLFDIAVDEKALRIVVESSGTYPKAARTNPEGGEDASTRAT